MALSQSRGRESTEVQPCRVLNYRRRAQATREVGKQETRSLFDLVDLSQRESVLAL